MKGYIMKTETKDIRSLNDFKEIKDFMKTVSDGNKYYYYYLNINDYGEKKDEAYIRTLPASEIAFPEGAKCEILVLSLNTAQTKQEFMFDEILGKIAHDKLKNKDLPYVCYVLNASVSKISMLDFEKYYAAFSKEMYGADQKDWTFRHDLFANVLYIYNV
jgi:hypothetical protein